MLMPLRRETDVDEREDGEGGKEEEEEEKEEVDKVNFHQLRISQQQSIDLEDGIPEDETDEQTDTRLNMWYEKWCHPDDDEVATFRRVRSLFGAKRDGAGLVDPTLHDKFYSIMTHYAHMMARLGDRRLADSSSPDPAVKTRYGKLLKISECIHYGLNMILCGGKVRLITNTRSQALIPDHLLQIRYVPPDFGDINKYQQLLLFYLQRARELQFRKKGTEIFKPILTDAGVFTHAWKRVSEIEDFVYSAVFPREHYPEQWKWLSDKPGNAKSAAIYLEKAWEHDFPFLNRDKKILSFRNGLYFVDRDVFRGFDHPEVTHSMTAANFFNVEFEVEKYDTLLRTCWCKQRRLEEEKSPPPPPTAAAAPLPPPPVGDGVAAEPPDEEIECTCEDDYMKLPTPATDSVLRHQGLTLDVMRWVYAMIGRLFFDVNERDSWQIQMFLKGVAGTGKSSLLRLAEYLFDPSDVGIFGNNVEINYPLEAIVDKHIYLAMDINDGFRLDQYIWQSMVSGEPVSVSRKFKTPKMVVWRSHGIFAGNGIMQWNDNGGSVSRRLMIVPFEKLVQRGDPKLLQKMKAEIAPFIKKCIMAYLSMVDNYAFVEIWSVLPPLFKETKKSLQKQTHSLEAFINSPKVRTGAELSVPQRLFEQAYVDFCHQQGLERKQMNSDFYALVFQKHGIGVDNVGGHSYMGSTECWEEPFVTGVDLTDNIRKYQRSLNAFPLPVVA